jgi:opacity protein-like surface antigen
MTVEGGVLYRLARGRMSPYVGGGVGYHALTEKSDALGTASGGGVGFLGTGGLAIAITPHVVLDIRAKYSSAKVQPSPRSPDVTFKVDAGGFTGGIGVGVIF